MANAVYVQRVQATAGNAVYVQSVKAATVAPTGNAVLVYRATAATVPAAGNAVFVHSLKTVVSGQAPVVTAGTDQTSVEPWATVTLTATVSSGTATSYTWTQAGGTPVTLTGTGATRTFTAPPSADGSSLLFSLTAANAAGLVSTPDTVVVSVLPVTEFAKVGGAWSPRRLRKRSGGAWV